MEACELLRVRSTYKSYLFRNWKTTVLSHPFSKLVHLLWLGIYKYTSYSRYSHGLKIHKLEVAL